MGKIRLEILPSLTVMLKEEGSDWLISEQKVGEGATIGGLLAELTSSYSGFREVFFNPDTGKVSDQVMVVLNGSLLQDLDLTEAKLNDGDTVILSPILTGG